MKNSQGVDCVTLYDQGAAATGAQLPSLLKDCTTSYSGNAVGACETFVRAGASACGGCLSQVPAPKGSVGDGIKTIIDIMGFIAGVLSAAFLVLGGVTYASSEGNPQRLASAKQTITYAIIGLVISILAPLIVGFAIGKAGLQ